MRLETATDPKKRSRAGAARIEGFESCPARWDADLDIANACAKSSQGSATHEPANEPNRPVYSPRGFHSPYRPSDLQNWRPELLRAVVGPESVFVHLEEDDATSSVARYRDGRRC